jgi:hypothetical protein
MLNQGDCNKSSNSPILTKLERRILFDLFVPLQVYRQPYRKQDDDHYRPLSGLWIEVYLHLSMAAMLNVIWSFLMSRRLLRMKLATSNIIERAEYCLLL